MVSELRLAKDIMKIFSTVKKLIMKFTKLSNYLKEGIEEAWGVLFTTKEKAIEEKYEVLFATLTGTFQEGIIWIIDSGTSSHMNGHHKQLKTLSK